MSRPLPSDPLRRRPVPASTITTTTTAAAGTASSTAVSARLYGAHAFLNPVATPSLLLPLAVPNNNSSPTHRPQLQLQHQHHHQLRRPRLTTTATRRPIALHSIPHAHRYGATPAFSHARQPHWRGPGTQPLPASNHLRSVPCASCSSWPSSSSPSLPMSNSGYLTSCRGSSPSSIPPSKSQSSSSSSFTFSPDTSSLRPDKSNNNDDNLSSTSHPDHSPWHASRTIRIFALAAGAGLFALSFLRPIISSTTTAAVVSTATAAAPHSTSSLVSLLTTHIRGIGPLSASLLLFVTNFFTVLFCFPANMGLMIAAGAMLPALYAFSALFLSKLAAACAAFVLSRTLLRSRAQAALSRYPRLARVLARPSLSSSNGDTSANLATNSATGWKFVTLMRLSPFPGFVLNYLLSLTDVSFVNYLFGSVIGMAPPILNLVLIGNAARQVGAGVSAGSGISTSTGGANVNGSSGTWSALAQWLPIALKLVTIFSMIAVTVHVSRAIASAFSEDDDGSNNTATISAVGGNNNNNASDLNDKAQIGNGSNNGGVTEGVITVDVDSDVNATNRPTDVMAMPVATSTMLHDVEVLGCDDEASSTGQLSLRLSTNDDSGNGDRKGSTDVSSHVAAKSVL